MVSRWSEIVMRYALTSGLLKWNQFEFPHSSPRIASTTSHSQQPLCVDLAKSRNQAVTHHCNIEEGAQMHGRLVVLR